MGSTTSKPVPSSSSRIDEKRRSASVEGVTSALGGMQLSSEPCSASGSLSLSNVENWEAAVQASPKLQLARTILAHSNITQALTSREARIADVHVFNNELEFKTGPVTNQKSSGRCWLFATTNILRYDIMKKLKLSEFQLSQSYLFFWDKLNKCNYYLELSIQHADLPLDDRLIYHLSDDLISDGGQWDMVVNLLTNYGVVPHAIYPESFHSSASSPMNKLIKTRLREHALILRKLSAQLQSDKSLNAEQVTLVLRTRKEELMKEIYTIMTATLGQPPNPNKPFTWDYYDSEGKPGSWEGTPLEFYQSFVSKAYPPSESFSLINDPRNEFSKLYTVDKLGNLWGGRPVLYVNTHIDDLKNAVVKMIKAGQPVFFGCDVGQFADRAGILDTALFEYENAFDISLTLTKADRLRVNESSMTHAMVISGVHLDKAGKPVRYKIENSWGADSGEKGYYVMTDRWFEQFVYQVVIPKALAPKELVKVFQAGDAVVLPAWDPMGSLA